MSSSSCFPLNCLSCKKSSKKKLKSPIQLPTIKEFLRKNPYTLDKERSTESFSPRLSKIVSISPKNCSSPQPHKSTIAMINGTVFTPLNINDRSVNSSIVSNIRKDTQDKTQFLSMQSFDSMFGRYKLDKKEAKSDPFKLGSCSKPKIMPITPSGWRRRTVQPTKVDLTLQKISKENKTENFNDSLVISNREF